MCVVNVHLLNIEEWKCDRLPEVVSVFTCHLEVFVPFFLNQRIVLNGYGIPHVVFLGKKRRKKVSMKQKHRRQQQQSNIVIEEAMLRWFTFVLQPTVGVLMKDVNDQTLLFKGEKKQLLYTRGKTPPKGLPCLFHIRI